MINCDSKIQDIQTGAAWNVVIGGREVNKSIRPINQPLDTKEQLAHAFKHYVIDHAMEEKLAEYLKNNKD